MLENLYEIKDIIAVRFKDDYQDYLSKEVINNLNGFKHFNDTFYYLDREIVKNQDGTYMEIYEDAILGILLYERIVKSDQEDYPDFIEEVKDVELEGLTLEEKEKGIVGSSKLFYNFQLINSLTYPKKKTLKIRRVG